MRAWSGRRRAAAVAVVVAVLAVAGCSSEPGGGGDDGGSTSEEGSSADEAPADPTSEQPTFGGDPGGPRQLDSAYGDSTFTEIVGYDDGFGGLRGDGSTVTALFSDDGDRWTAAPTDGLPGDLFVRYLDHDSAVGSFVLVGETGYGADGAAVWVGTSPDLATWEVSQVSETETLWSRPTSLAVENGELYATLWTDDPVGDASPSTFVHGPIAGPYTTVEVPTDDVFFDDVQQLHLHDGTAYLNQGFALYRSDDFEQWSLVDWSSQSLGDEAASLGDAIFTIDSVGSVGSDVVAYVDSIPLYLRSADGGDTWTSEPLPVDGVTGFSSVIGAGQLVILAPTSSTSLEGDLDEDLEGNVLIHGEDGWRAVSSVEAGVLDANPFPLAVNTEELLVAAGIDGTYHGIPLAG